MKTAKKSTSKRQGGTPMKASWDFERHTVTLPLSKHEVRALERAANDGQRITWEFRVTIMTPEQHRMVSR